MDSSPRSDDDGPSPPRRPSHSHSQSAVSHVSQAHAADTMSDSPAAKRRKKDGNDLRQRVTRACDRCKKRKVRCTGVRPCEHCIEAGTHCTYDLSYARGRLPSIPSVQTVQSDQSPSPSNLPASSYGVLASPVSTERSSAHHQDNATADGAQAQHQVDDAAAAQLNQQRQQQQQQQQQQQRPTEGLSFLSAAAAEMDRRPGDNTEGGAAFGLTVPGSIPLALPQSSSSLPPATEVPAASSRVSPEPLQTDLQGHYVGPASGVSFLLRVQKRLHDNVSFLQQSSSSIFTFGDAPLQPQAHDDFDSGGGGSGTDPGLLFLTKPEANRLLARYFDFAVPTHRFLHRPTVESWLNTFFATRGRMTTMTSGNNGNGNGSGNGRDSREDGRAEAAVLFMVFAQARDYLRASEVTADMDSSAHYYRAAELQLAREKGAVRVASVQARLCQCFYLLSQSRINHCWSLFGTTAHLALAIGLNRNRRADPAGGLSHIDVECRRRTFWCAYSLDNYLSAALGRPRTFHDEDIDQELPSIAEDDDILHSEIIRQPNPTTGTGIGLSVNQGLNQGLGQSLGQGLGFGFSGMGMGMTTGGGSGGYALRGMSVMLAPVAHVRLSKIVSMILRDLYAIRPISSTTRATLTAKHTAALLAWRQDDTSLARFLDADHVSASLLIPIFQRQRNVLNLAYYHALLLTHRPVLLSNFAYLRQGASGSSGASNANNSSSRTDGRDPDVRAQAQANMKQCLDAAMNIISIVNDLFQDGQLFRAYWFTMYFAFSAVVVVYVYIIQHQSAPQSTYGAYLAAAVACQSQIARLAENGSLTQRYSLVLEELRLVTLQHAEAFQTTLSAQGNGAGQTVNGGMSSGIGYSQSNNEISGDLSGLNDQPQQHQQQPQPNPGLDLSAVPLAGGLIGGLAGGIADWNGSPSSSLADVTSWGYFDSMVSSGFWPLDSLLSEDHQLRV
ncbi:hypothetical protein SEUCBS139899_003926 [Sporothrix eucalyptigena]